MKTNIWNEQELITKFLNELLNVINHLPYPSNIRSLLKYNVIVDFVNSWQFDDSSNSISFSTYTRTINKQFEDDLNFTEGIDNFNQANRYVYEFIKLLKHVRVEALEDIFFPPEMYFIDPSKPKKSVTFHDVDKYTLLKSSKVDIYTTDDFTVHLIKMFGDAFQEVMRQNIMADVNETPPPNNINKMIFDHVSAKIYMIEELEYIICIEAVNYSNYLLHHSLRDENLHEHFESLFQGPIKEKFNRILNNRLEILTPFEKLFYLDNSVHQRNSHAPDSRIQELYDKFWKTFTFPKNTTIQVSDPFIKYMDKVIAVYEDHFLDYLQIIEDKFFEYKIKFPHLAKTFISIEDYQISFGELPNPIGHTQINGEQQNQNKSKNQNNASFPIAFTYLNNSKNYGAVLDLFDSLQKNAFIALDTDKKDFRKIFENKKPNKPITWTGRISYLFLFVKLIHSKYKLIDKLGKKVWVISDQLFVDENGEAFGSQRLKGQKVPNDATAIENAVALLK